MRNLLSLLAIILLVGSIIMIHRHVSSNLSSNNQLTALNSENKTTIEKKQVFGSSHQESFISSYFLRNPIKMGLLITTGLVILAIIFVYWYFNRL